MSEAILFFKKICKGYEILHQKQILHRDIKLENILLHSGEPKIGDFGFGKVVEGNVDE
jgi:serine/threonine protein kinase